MAPAPSALAVLFSAVVLLLFSLVVLSAPTDPLTDLLLALAGGFNVTPSPPQVPPISAPQLVPKKFTYYFCTVSALNYSY